MCNRGEGHFSLKPFQWIRYPCRAGLVLSTDIIVRFPSALTHSRVTVTIYGIRTPMVCIHNHKHHYWWEHKVKAENKQTNKKKQINLHCWTELQGAWAMSPTHIGCTFLSILYHRCVRVHKIAGNWSTGPFWWHPRVQTAEASEL